MSKIAFVSGASRGIGKAIALQLAKDGFDIFIHYKSNSEKAESVKQEVEALGQKAYLVAADLTKVEDIKGIANQIEEHANKIDVLVNNAGISQFFNLEQTEDQEIFDVISVVLTAKILLTKYLLPLLKKGQNASVINIASRMGNEKTIEGISIYGPAEAGTIKFSKCCALEFAPYGIRVNTVSPGLTNTDLTKDWIEELGGKEVASKNIPLKRIAEPEDIANAVSFLASDKASYINGENLGVNGGSNLG